MDAVRAIVEDAVARGVFPGGVLLVADGGREVLARAFGQRAPGSAAVTLDTRYDVASLTKAVVTTTLTMRLVAAGSLALVEPAQRWVPELLGPGKDRIRIRDLLSHSSGLPPWRPLYESAADREAILGAAAATPLDREPGASSVYSDLGFIVLGFVVERAGGDRLDRLAERQIFAPTAMTASGFVDLSTPPAQHPGPVAPTEICPRRGLMCGAVHDENCHAAGGVLGHAGLFSTAPDLSRFAAAMVSSWRGDSGSIVDAEIARQFFSPCGVPGSTWRLGWDGPSLVPGASQAGDAWPKSGVGHLGFTGCSLWIDLERARWVVLLTNRVHPSRADQRIKEMRPRLHDAVVRALADH